MRYTVLGHWNGVSLFLVIARTKSVDLNLFTGAFVSQGCGRYCHGLWFQGYLPSDKEDQIPDHELSMAYKELVPGVAAAEIRESHCPHKRIQFMCDKQNKCYILNKIRSRSCVIMQLIHASYLKGCLVNFAFTAEFIA